MGVIVPEKHYPDVSELEVGGLGLAVAMSPVIN